MAIATLRALAREIYIHQMAGFSPEKVKSNFNLPDGYEPASMFVFGHLGDPAKLPEDLADQEDPQSEREDVNTFLFGKQWGQPYLP
jgi:hypothetical protein